MDLVPLSSLAETLGKSGKTLAARKADEWIRAPHFSSFHARARPDVPADALCPVRAVEVLPRRAGDRDAGADLHGRGQGAAEPRLWSGADRLDPALPDSVFGEDGNARRR